MQNPFLESDNDDSDDIKLVENAKNGSLDALETLILRHQAWIYNICIRMVFSPHDAEDATQEVLIKAITHLDSFRGESKFRTWLYRIAANHILNMKRRGGEVPPLSFAGYGAGLDNIPDLDLPDPKSVPVDVPLLVEESKLACMTGMLLCLDRRQRLIFTLGEILGASDVVGSEIMEMTPDNFRQCLSRARRDLYHFMNNQCGLVNTNNPCRCVKKTKAFIDEGHIDPKQLMFASSHMEQIADIAADTVREVDDLVERQYATLFRAHPFLQPSDQIRWLRKVLEQPGIRSALRIQ